jgi:tetratricopeptide (TPR) repeat protein
MWESTYVAVKFDVPTDQAVTAAIEKTMAGPSAGDYYASAVYYMNADKDLDKAKMWMDKAMAMSEEPAFWQLRQQSLLYAKMGDKKNAIATAKKSLEKSKAAGNADYEKMNMDSLKEWGAM